VYGENALNPANLTAVAPPSDVGLPGDMLDRLTMYALQQFQADDLAKLPGHFAFTVYHGDEPLETFEKGGDQYAKVITATDRAAAVFDQQFARDVSVWAVHFTQGETPGTMPRAKPMQICAFNSGNSLVQLWADGVRVADQAAAGSATTSIDSVMFGSSTSGGGSSGTGFTGDLFDLMMFEGEDVFATGNDALLKKYFATVYGTAE